MLTKRTKKKKKKRNWTDCTITKQRLHLKRWVLDRLFNCDDPLSIGVPIVPLRGKVKRSYGSLAREIELLTCESNRRSADAGIGAGNRLVSPAFESIFKIRLLLDALSRSRDDLSNRVDWLFRWWPATPWQKVNPGFRWANRCIRPGDQVTGEIG